MEKEKTKCCIYRMEYLQNGIILGQILVIFYIKSTHYLVNFTRKSTR
jgi:hypothetical protein